MELTDPLELDVKIVLVLVDDLFEPSDLRLQGNDPLAVVGWRRFVFPV